MKNKVDKFIKNPKKALFTMALPITVGMLVQLSYNIIDTAYVGRLGSEAIAALTFAFPFFFILMSLNAMTATGMASRISRFLGAKKKKEAENTALHGFFLTMILAVLVFILGITFLEPIFLLFGATDMVLELSKDYMSIILAAVFFMFPVFLFNYFFSSQGDTKTPMIVQVSSVVLNIILDPVFIYGLDMGIKGAAWASLISFAFGALLYAYFIITRSHLKLRIRCFSFNISIVKEIIHIGVPASFMMLLLSTYVIFLNRVMVHFSTEHVAAFGLGTRMESLAFLPIIGLALSLMTISGMFVGAKRYELLEDIIFYGLKMGALITSGVGLAVFLFAQYLLRIFTADPLIIGLGTAYLRIDVLTFPLMAVGMIISRAMQGMGYGLPGFAINFVRIFGVAIPLAYIFVFMLGFGYLSVAWAMVAGGIAGATVAIIWLRTKLNRFLAKHA